MDHNYLRRKLRHEIFSLIRDLREHERVNPNIYINFFLRVVKIIIHIVMVIYPNVISYRRYAPDTNADTLEEYIKFLHAYRREISNIESSIRSIRSNAHRTYIRRILTIITIVYELYTDEIEIHEDILSG